jgi:serine phosphatase RsbU (regulator of sigma subunit)
VPLIKAGRPVALLVVHHATAHPWSVNEITLIEETADRTWDAVERARVEQTLRESEARERRGRQRAEWVAELLSDLEAVEGTDSKARQLVTFLTKHLADHAVLEAPGNPPTIVAERHRRPGRVAPVGGASPRRTSVPIELGPYTTGTLTIGRLDPAAEDFTPSDLALLREIADRAGLLLTRAQLREEERNVSVRLQRALLPDTLATHPDLVISAHYEAAGSLLEVGGDWYDTYSWPEGHIGVMVGDVMGHDLQAAAAMGRLRAGVGALVSQLPPSPAAVLTALDRCATGADGTSFVTAAAVVIDAAHGRLTYASAGHPPMLLLPPDGEPRWLRDALSPPAGTERDPERPERTVDLEPGTVLLMYSDGLIERRTQDLDSGMSLLRRLATDLVHPDEDQLAARIAAAMSAERPTEDDVVVVAIRYAPRPSTD